MIKVKFNIILASNSQIRAQLLKEIIPSFTIRSNPIDEASLKKNHAQSARQLALTLAKAKAGHAHYQSHNDLIIGCDQTCQCGERILSKPQNISRAKQQLELLSEQTHQLHSAIAVFQKGRCLWEHVETATMTMRRLSASEIKNYLETDQAFDSCGAYYFEKNGKHLFSSVTGNDDVILGLPRIALLNFLYQNELIHIG